jgi:hypothetical protein
MEFKPLSQEQIQELLKGQVNVLTPLVEKEEAFFRNCVCLVCHGGTEPFVDPVHPFSPGSPLPRRFLRCTNCGTEFDPYTNLVTKAATPSSG